MSHYVAYEWPYIFSEQKKSFDQKPGEHFLRMVNVTSRIQLKFYQNQVESFGRIFRLRVYDVTVTTKFVVFLAQLKAIYFKKILTFFHDGKIQKYLKKFHEVLEENVILEKWPK